MWNSRADLRMQLREISPYCLAMPAVSKYAIVALVPSEWVATNKVRVIEYKGPWLHAMLLSQWFEAWVWKYSGRMGSTIINLAVSGAIRTFPLLSLDNDWARDWIDAWDRSIIAATRQGEGQTSFWNRYHSQSADTGIAHCRTLRAELDDKISTENGFTIFTSAEVQIDVGPRFGWDGGQRESAVSLMHAVNSDQGNGGKRAKRVPRRPSSTVTGSQGSFEGF